MGCFLVFQLRLGGRCKMFSLFYSEGLGAGVGCFPCFAVKGGGKCRMFSWFSCEGWGQV